MLLEAGPLGENSVASFIADASSPTPSGSSPGLAKPTGHHSGLAPGPLAGIILGTVIFLCATGGFCFLIFKKKLSETRLDLDLDGLEVGATPPGFDHVRNVELEAEPSKSELWTIINTPEFGGSNTRAASLGKGQERPGLESAIEEAASECLKQNPTTGDRQGAEASSANLVETGRETSRLRDVSTVE
ncbi:uncharacterized protein PAC_11082 [Phialocephala subalpina]|uniref:Uncharacterized protein n=1 Tax=Phialocephala subalpina TaxID=576137 RepID=A0A1L7X847_9HELO|nr:uncharacterized protein PAC_11082 [Phialocephala subalpina]